MFRCLLQNHGRKRFRKRQLLSNSAFNNSFQNDTNEKDLRIIAHKENEK